MGYPVKIAAGCIAIGATLLGISGCASHVGGTSATVNINGNSITINGNEVGKNSATDSVQQKFEAATVTTVKTETDTGTIELTSSPAAANEIHIVARRSVRGSEAPEALKPMLSKIQASASLDGHTLVVKAVVPPELQKNGHSASVDYVIVVPERMLYDLRSSAGNITLKGLRGGGSAHSDVGTVSATNCAGAVTLTTSAGSVDVADSEDISSATLKTDDGAITINRIGGRVTADTSNGEITVDASPKATQLTLHSDNGAVSVSNSAGSIEAETSNGAVTVTRCKVSGTLKLTSDNGAVEARDITAVGGALHSELKSSSGAVAYHGDASELTAESDSGSAQAEISRTLKLLSADVRSANGEASITLPSTASATVTVDSSNGRADVPGGMAATESSSERSTVQMGSGSAKVSVHSDNGNATLHTGS